MNKMKKGFTIVELVIVIAVIAILAAVLIPTFSNIIRSANESSDSQLVRNLNTILVTDKAANGKHTNYQQVLDLVDASGYDVAKIMKTKATDNAILWDSKNDIFCYLKGDEVVYIPNSIDGDPTKENVDLWKVYSDIASAEADTSGYSAYLAGEDLTGEISIAGRGIDVGRNAGITKVSYFGAASAQNVVIRTNGSDAVLTVNAYENGLSGDAYKCDTVIHFGECGIVNIINGGKASYHEKGTVGFAEITKGKLVLEATAEVEIVNIAKKDDVSYDDIIIEDNGVKELPSIISRDQVEVTAVEGIKVCEVVSASGTEIVKAYPAAGVCNSTEKVTEGANKQNETVGTTLGMLVIDSGLNAGEKAFDEATKENKKDEVAAEANSASMNLDDKYIARIGTNGYTTIKSAFESVQNGETIIMLKDYDLAGSKVPNGDKIDSITKSFTFNLASKSIITYLDCFTLVGDSSVTFKNGTFYHYESWEPIFAKENSTVIVENMKISSPMYSVYLSSSSNASAYIKGCDFYSSGDGVLCLLGSGDKNVSDTKIVQENASTAAVQVAGNCIVDNCYIEGSTTGVYQNGAGLLTIKGNTKVYAQTCLEFNGKYHAKEAESCVGTDNFGGYDFSTVIESCEFIATDIAIYHPNEQALIINGGYFEGKTALYAKNGNIEINGGSFIGNGNFADYLYAKSGAESTGDAIVLEASNYYNSDDSIAHYTITNPKVTINGGTFTSKNNKGIKVFNVNGNTVTLTNNTTNQVAIEEKTK